MPMGPDDVARATSLESLRQTMAERDHLTLSLDQTFREARRVWAEHAHEAASTPSTPPLKLEPITVEAGGVRYDTYGVIHGLVGGDAKDYKAFVDDTVATLSPVLFENGFSYFYPHGPEMETIPDFVVLGAIGSVVVSLHVAVEFPRILLDFVRELLHKAKKKAESGGGSVAFDRAYHALPAELRRGLDSPAALPANLEIEAMLPAWERRRPWGALWDTVGCVPRSVFMAGYAVGYAQRTKSSSVSIVVGDLHLTEIVYALSHPEMYEQRLFKAGQRAALRANPARTLWFYAWKLRHLLIGGVGGTLPFVVLINLLVWYWPF